MPESSVTLDAARAMHDADLHRMTSDPVAQRQLELRKRGRDLARGVLRHVLGTSFSGTGGWHVIAHVSPEGLLGFVNIAEGVAVITNAHVEPDILEALTIPDQPTGSLASGAAAWTVPDAGEAHRSESPRGWRQLLIDLRGEVPEVPVHATICAWGLRTCYSSEYSDPKSPGRRGAPGKQALSNHQVAPLPAWEWEIPRGARARMTAVAQRIVHRITLQLAETAGIRDAIEACVGSELPASEGLLQPPTGGIADAIRATGAYSSHPSGYNAEGVVHSVVRSPGGRAIKDALRRAGITRLCALAGDLDENRVGGLRYLDLLTYLVERILVRDLTPTSQALWQSLARYETPSSSPEGWQMHQRVVGPMLEKLLPDVADLALAGLVHSDAICNQDEEEVFSALYADGYLEVQVPAVALNTQAS